MPAPGPSRDDAGAGVPAGFQIRPATPRSAPQATWGRRYVACNRPPPYRSAAFPSAGFRRFASRLSPDSLSWCHRSAVAAASSPRRPADTGIGAAGSSPGRDRLLASLAHETAAPVTAPYLVRVGILALYVRRWTTEEMERNVCGFRRLRPAAVLPKTPRVFLSGTD